MRNPFVIAEQYIQLKKKCAPKTWGDSVIRINEMIITPLVTIFFIFVGQWDVMMVITALISTARIWKEWLDYNEARLAVQRMYLHTMRVGGPFIVTNDPEYLPYVFADAVYRVPVGISNAPPGGKLDG